MDTDLAKQLQNPIANLISLPLQNNFDYGGGPGKHGSQYTLNVQPVIPFKLTDSWNLITRTIVPVTSVAHVLPESTTAIGDIVQSFFLSPSRPVAGLIVGAGPVILYPSASDDRLGANQWAAGPTFVALKQTGPWTVGMLANHLQGFGAVGRHDVGEDLIGLDEFTPETHAPSPRRISASFLQPFVSYTFPTSTSLTFQTESTYDWTARRWTVPLEAIVGQVLTVGQQPVSLSLGGKYWAVQPAGAPAWGLRLALTLLFPT